MFSLEQKLYQIRMAPNSMQKKICMTDQDGVEWFRWDGPRFKHAIEECTVIGITTSTLIGMPASDAEPEHKGAIVVHLHFTNKPSEWLYETDLKNYLTAARYWFLNYEDAKQRISSIKDD